MNDGATARERRALPHPPVQLITGTWRDARDLESRVRAAVHGGVRWIQLRSKHASALELYEGARTIAPIVRGAGGVFVINDRIDVAVAAGADGVHLPEDGMTAADARTLVGAGAWIARSVHSVEAVRALASDPLDAVQLGPVFETPSKREFGPPLGPGVLAEAARERLPVVAVGGITPARIDACRAAGARGVSIIGAIWDAPDVEAAAREACRQYPTG